MSVAISSSIRLTCDAFTSLLLSYACLRYDTTKYDTIMFPTGVMVDRACRRA